MGKFLASTLALPLLASAAFNCTAPNAIHYISIRGHGGGGDPNHWNVLQGLREMVVAQIPGSDAVPLPYDYNNAAETTGIPSGRGLLTAYIQDYVTHCPNSYIGMLGFSEGALIAMDTICGSMELGLVPSSPIDSKYAKNVIAIATYGDESRYPNQPWNKGSCTGIGEFPRFNSAQCNPFGAGIASFCDTGDSYCCSSTDDSQTGAVHANYINKYNQAVVDHFKARIAAANAGAARSASGSNGPSTAKSTVPTAAPTGGANLLGMLDPLRGVVGGVL